jgi:carboxypeptidase Taq
VVAPGYIRVEADEATYNLHIIIRFGLERQMLKGELAVQDLPEAWNARYRELLGIEVTDDAHGCLQDIHWSMTAMGYFPTYTLGNLHAAQLFEAACLDHPSLVDGFSRGEFAPLREWLNTKVHAEGKRYGALELTEKLTGKPLSAEPLMRHLEGKLLPLYGLD